MSELVDKLREVPQERAGAINEAPTASPYTYIASRREHTFQKLLRRQSSDPLLSGTTASDLALIQYTSGTTDTSKGVMLSHCNLVMNLTQVVHWMAGAQRGREIVLGVLPLSHSYGITSAMNAAMGLAATLVLLPTRRVEEMMEAWTLNQLGDVDKPVGLLDVEGFYQPFLGFIDQMVTRGFLPAAHRSSIAVSPDPAALLDALAALPPITVPKWMS